MIGARGFGAKVTLELTIHSDRLSVTIGNSSARELRLWEWDNSWGWYSLAVQARDDSNSEIAIRHKPREWTKNGPVHFVLLPQEKREVSIAPRDGWWEVADSAGLELAGWQNRALEIRVRLQIEPTPESDRFGVFTGAVFSPWIASAPPHGWLPAWH